MSDRLDEDLAPRLRRSDRLVADRMGDARNHALIGDLADASQRLVDLHHGLAGPHGEGLIGDARAAFYREAHRGFDPAVHDPAWIFPTAEGSEAARTIPLFGDDAHLALGDLVDHARRSMLGAAAIRRPDSRAAAIRNWHRRHAAAIRSWAASTLSNSQIVIHSAVEAMRIRPEYRDDG